MTDEELSSVWMKKWKGNRYSSTYKSYKYVSSMAIPYNGLPNCIGVFGIENCEVQDSHLPWII